MYYEYYKVRAIKPSKDRPKPSESMVAYGGL